MTAPVRTPRPVAHPSRVPLIVFGVAVPVAGFAGLIFAFVDAAVAALPTVVLVGALLLRGAVWVRAAVGRRTQ